MRMWDRNVGFSYLDRSGWPWMAGAAAALTVLGVYRGYYAPAKRRMTFIYDVSLPLALGVLTVALIWGLGSRYVVIRLRDLSQKLNNWGTPLEPSQLRLILTFGVPCVLCYTFIERTWRFSAGVACLLLAWLFTGALQQNIVLQQRSFFGALKVEVGVEEDRYENEIAYRRLVHGTTLHGKQFHPEYLQARKKQQVDEWLRDWAEKFRDEQRRRPDADEIAAQRKKYEDQYDEYEKRGIAFGDQPLTYYHRTGPIGYVMRAYMANRDPNKPGDDRRRLPPLGVIGLGTGSMAAYGQKGQKVVFYDIDKLVKEISFDNDKHFSFVQKAKDRGVDISLVLNDARLAIEREVDQPGGVPEEDRFGVLIVDAFSSDAIPIHLITVQALDLYLKRVAEDGIIAFHISNRYLDLKPVLGNLGAARGLTVIYMSDSEHDQDWPGKAASSWVLLARKPEYLSRLRQGDQGFAAWADTVDLLEREPQHRAALDRNLTNIQNDVYVVNYMQTTFGAQMLLQSCSMGGPVLDPGSIARSLMCWRLTQMSGPLEVMVTGTEARAKLVRPGGYWYPVPPDPKVGVWTDDYAAIMRVFIPLRPDRTAD
jgi:hypothetical protein